MTFIIWECPKCGVVKSLLSRPWQTQRGLICGQLKHYDRAGKNQYCQCKVRLIDQEATPPPGGGIEPIWRI